jgi:hypothetical protein
MEGGQAIAMETGGCIVRIFDHEDLSTLLNFLFHKIG